MTGGGTEGVVGGEDEGGGDDVVEEFEEGGGVRIGKGGTKLILTRSQYESENN